MFSILCLHYSFKIELRSYDTYIRKVFDTIFVINNTFSRTNMKYISHRNIFYRIYKQEEISKKKKKILICYDFLNHQSIY